MTPVDDKFVINDDTDSDTATESNLPLRSQSFLNRVNVRLRKILDHSSKDLQDTPPVLSLGKLCDEHGYTCEWINGKKTHLIKRYSDTVQHGKLRTNRGSWFTNEFFLKLALFNINDTFKTGN